MTNNLDLQRGEKELLILFEKRRSGDRRVEVGLYGREDALYCSSPLKEARLSVSFVFLCLSQITLLSLDLLVTSHPRTPPKAVSKSCLRHVIMRGGLRCFETISVATEQLLLLPSEVECEREALSRRNCSPSIRRISEQIRPAPYSYDV